MRITFVTPFLSRKGGIRVILTYARHLAARGHEVFVVSTPRAVPGLRQRIKGLLRGRRPAPAGGRTELADFLGPRHVEIDRVRPVADADVPDADVVFATWWETAEWVARLAPEKGRKFYLIQDYEMFRDELRDRVAATYAAPLRKIAVSGWIRDTIAKNHGIGDVAVLANAVDTGHFTAPPRVKRPGLRVGFLYTPVPRKNVGLAIAAIARAREAIPGFEALVFGAHPPTADRPLPDWVDYRLAPPEAGIPGIYAACDLWLFTSDHEGFGLPLLEAMACRTPVLATRAGAAPDLVDGRNGLLLDGTPEAFAEAMRRFAAMPDAEWQGWSEAAFRTARALGWAEQTAALERLLTAPEAGTDHASRRPA